MPKEIEEPDVCSIGDAALTCFHTFLELFWLSVPAQACRPNPLLCRHHSICTHVCVKPALRSSSGVFVLQKVCVLGGVLEGHVHVL